MMRVMLEEQLTQLNNSLIEISGIVEQAIMNANTALINQDVELAKKIISTDDIIDIMEKEIESLCIRIILQQQPVASDLRFITSVLKILTDVERIGDHASDISELIVKLADKTYIKDLEHIPQMAEATLTMVKHSIEAFVKRDIALANDVVTRDDQVDDLFETVKNDLIDLIKKDANNGEQAIDLIMIAKYFEKIGDHATNVAEWVVFTLTGKHKKEKFYNIT